MDQLGTPNIHLL